MIRKLLAFVWNQSIDAFGAIFGAVLRNGVRRNWIHFPFASEALSRLPFSIGWKLRRAVYARVLPNIGRDAILHFAVVLDDPRTVIGDDVWISVGTYIDYVEIGNHVLIGPHAVLLSGGRHHSTDRLDIPIKQQGNPPKRPISISDGAWIGANATVMADVGHDAIVGAGAVVTKAVPPFAVVAGNPARILHVRGQQEMAIGLGEIRPAAAPEGAAERVKKQTGSA
jgi:acetyltransferase-like isoleucine patch superfamily enzyme